MYKSSITRDSNFLQISHSRVPHSRESISCRRWVRSWMTTIFQFNHDHTIITKLYFFFLYWLSHRHAEINRYCFYTAIINFTAINFLYISFVAIFIYLFYFSILNVITLTTTVNCKCAPQYESKASISHFRTRTSVNRRIFHHVFRYTESRTHATHARYYCSMTPETLAI